MVVPSSNEQVMRFVKMVQKRYYLVHRLEKPMNFLIHSYQALIQQKSAFDFYAWFQDGLSKGASFKQDATIQFTHPAIIKYAKELEKGLLTSSIKNLWSDFLSYKHIDDEQFVREAIVIVMIMYKALIVEFNSIHVEKKSVFALFKGEKDFNKQEIYDNFHSIIDILDESYKQEDFVITNNLRHYHIQRLLKSIAILTKVDTQYLYPLWDCLTNTIHNNAIQFHHAAVQECLSLILKTKSLEPLFGLWRHFRAYKFINDSLFLQEFVTLEYILYRKVIDCLKIVVAKKPLTAQDLEELYSSIAALPVPEMLNSLDTLVEELIVIMEKYELDSTMSWTQWLKKYWWVPPVVCVSVVVNFVLPRSNGSLAAISS
jgi:hypothetical protein